MIARVAVRLRPDLLRRRVREAVREAAARRASDALARAERPIASGPPDEKLTTQAPPDGLSRDV